MEVGQDSVQNKDVPGGGKRLNSVSSVPGKELTVWLTRLLSVFMVHKNPSHLMCGCHFIPSQVKGLRTFTKALNKVIAKGTKKLPFKENLCFTFSDTQT